MMTLSDPILIIFGTFILHQLIFWTYNGIILLFTYVIYPDRSKEYKIQKVVYIELKNSFLYEIFVFLSIGCLCRFKIS